MANALADAFAKNLSFIETSAASERIPLPEAPSIDSTNIKDEHENGRLADALLGHRRFKKPSQKREISLLTSEQYCRLLGMWDEGS